MNKEFFYKYRILFHKQNCVHCNKYMSFIQRINAKLSINKRIILVDCTYWQNYRIITNPFIALFNKYIQGFPLLIIDGMLINGINSKIETEAFLMSYLQKDFIVAEHNKYRFNKECDYDSKGRIVCN